MSGYNVPASFGRKNRLNTILEDNLKSALYLAIKQLEAQGMPHCIAADAYRENLALLEDGNPLVVVYET